MTRRHAAIAVAGLVAVTIARILLAQHLHDQGYFAKYLVFADDILRGQIPRARLLDVSPGYLWLIVALRALGLGVTAIRALQLVLVSVAAWCAAMAARRFGNVAMIAAAVFILMSRGAFLCATELEPETLILVLNAAALAAWMHDRRILAGALLGLSAICRPSALLIVILLLAVARRRPAGWLGAVSAPVLIVLALNFALTGEFALMDPGTVFYEGMNPNATGLAGVQPRVVNDLERLTTAPDTLHEAYRYVASRAAGRAVTRAESNHYWTGKALAFARAYPTAALRLEARKFLFAVHAYEPQDLATMARKNAELSPWLFLPFSLLAGLALIALLRRPDGLTAPLAFALGSGAVLIVFYVTTRQRDALLPAMSVLAAAGVSRVAHASACAPERTLKRALHGAVALLIAILLAIPTNVQREDAAAWRGEHNAFDDAIALENAGRWSEADALLAQLTDYHPSRENRAVNSVAYYRARAAQHLSRDPRPFLAQAEKEAPGDAHVLSLQASLGDPHAKALLFALHDPITIQRSIGPIGPISPIRPTGHDLRTHPPRGE